jgi:hypothetical protein
VAFGQRRPVAHDPDVYPIRLCRQFQEARHGGPQQGGIVPCGNDDTNALIAIAFQQWLTRRFWTGNPVNNNVGGGYAEFPGMDILVSTNKVDAFTGVTCPALYSDVKDFAFNAVDSATPDILNYLSMMEFYLRHIAERTNLMPVDWVLAMRPELFFELTAVWPCKYLTYRCANDAGANIGVINDSTKPPTRGDEMGSLK